MKLSEFASPLFLLFVVLAMLLGVVMAAGLHLGILMSLLFNPVTIALVALAAAAALSEVTRGR
jgi:uncharacterized protein (DUF2062 family)